MTTAADDLSPMMRQLQQARDRHPGMMVLFQNGEFFELFGPDATHGAKILGITLTRRDDIAMAGFPLAKLDYHLRTLLNAGERVAVVEQMEPPGVGGKKIIHRDVTRVVTLGTSTEDEILDARQANHLVAIAKCGTQYGLAWLDLGTGQFLGCDVKSSNLGDDFARLQAAELLLAEADSEAIAALLGPHRAKSVTRRPDWTFDAVISLECLKKQFQVSTFTGFGFDDRDACLVAAGAITQYLHETLKASLGHLKRLQPWRAGDYVVLDEVTRRSLELTKTHRDGTREGSLVAVMDRTITPMGARALHEAILAPLTDVEAINARLDAVQELKDGHTVRADLRELLNTVADLPRLTTRAATARATPRDLGAIARTLAQLPAIKAKLAGRGTALLGTINEGIELFAELRQTLETTFVEEPPAGAKDGGIIREGCRPDLDELRQLARDGKTWITQYQAQEITRSGIHSLKVGYTGVIGYYIEITNTHEHKVPPNYIHERTLKNAKRYVTPELKEYEDKVLTAEEKSKALEFEIFLQVRDAVGARAERLLATAERLALLDMLASFAELAAARNYCRPVITQAAELTLVESRHPVLDIALPPGTFTANDVSLCEASGVFWLITGPNMSGKSTYIRQVALLALMAHVGSFVPAASATVGLVDRIFTRVGASDELSRGQSTFMVEMTEAANILNNCTPRSLVILDEIGRGTSTYDGVSLAWAITEHLHDVPQCRTLFATHYHELAQLAEVLPRLRNYHVKVAESDGEVVFLHRIAPGNADKSYGIHVAKIAGLPESVLIRATAVLQSLESPHLTPVQRKPRMKKAKPDLRNLFEDPHEFEA